MTILRLLLVTLSILVIGGCGASKEDEIHNWMVEERNQTRPQVKAIDAPKPFVPESYTNGQTVEPFNMQKLAQALRQDSAQTAANAALVAPELARRKEPLEAFPLESMAMVGSLQRAGQPVALVKVDSLLYQVKIGNYLGTNYGKVTKISETEITMREIAQDGVGEWAERIATLQLQEGSK